MASFNKLTIGLFALFFSQTLLSSCRKENNPPAYMISHYYIVGNDTLSRLFVPSAFTPDRDGRNEYFKPIVDYFLPDTWELYVLEQTGNKIIYQSNSYSSYGWDGMYRGIFAMSTTYSYLIRYKAPDNHPLEFSGSFMLWD